MDYSTYTLEEIERLASANDKDALFEYGRRLEEGAGIKPQDRKSVV